jgi:ankyrin repeat protein
MGDIFYLNSELKKSALLGYLELCNFFIDSGADDLDGAYYAACAGGFVELVKSLIETNVKVNEKNRTEKNLNYNLGLIGSCESATMELIELNIANGANNFDTCLLIGARINNIQITEIMIEQLLKQGAENNFYDGFNTACSYGSTEVIKYLADNRRVRDFNLGFFLVCKNSNQELARYLFEKGATNTNICLYAVCAKGDVEMIKLLISLGANDFTEAIKYAATEEIRKLLT